MVEYILSLDNVFSSLADPTRRDILRRISHQELTVGQIAKPYSMSFAAVSKHLMVLEKAKLIIKRRRGKEQMINISPQALADAEAYLEQFRVLWVNRLDRLGIVLEQENIKLNK